VSGYSPNRVLSRGFGGPAAAMIGNGLLVFSVIVEEIRRILGRSSNRNEFVFDNDINVYNISALLESINNDPLNNTVYNKITKMIIDKKIKINISHIDTTYIKNDIYKVVVEDIKVKRGYNE